MYHASMISVDYCIYKKRLARIPKGQIVSSQGHVYVWTALSDGVHVQGGLEAEPTEGCTVGPFPKCFFRGQPDEDGIVDLYLERLPLDR